MSDLVFAMQSYVAGGSQIEVVSENIRVSSSIRYPYELEADAVFRVPQTCFEAAVGSSVTSVALSEDVLDEANELGVALVHYTSLVAGSISSPVKLIDAIQTRRRLLPSVTNRNVTVTLQNVESIL